MYAVRLPYFNFHVYTVHLDIIKFFFNSPTDAPVSCFKNSIKLYIEIYIKTAPTCFGVTVTPSSGSALICAHYIQSGPKNVYTLYKILMSKGCIIFLGHSVYTFIYLFIYLFIMYAVTPPPY